MLLVDKGVPVSPQHVLHVMTSFRLYLASRFMCACLPSWLQRGYGYSVQHAALHINILCVCQVRCSVAKGTLFTMQLCISTYCYAHLWALTGLLSS